MAGLLAWAADVVGGGSSSDRVEAEYELTAEQQEQMRRLDSRALALQREIQQLRQTLPHPHIAQRLPHLHADSLTSQSALALELHAHSATRLQLQIREASLQSENASYAKALAATQQQANEKAQESRALEACLEEMHELEKALRTELCQLEAQCADNDTALNEFQIPQQRDEASSFSPLASAENGDLQPFKNELESWEAKAKALQEELFFLQQSSSRWPSSVQREKELERRLRSLTEQLVAKQAQVESLMIERDALEHRVEQMSEGCEHIPFVRVNYGTKRNQSDQAGVSPIAASFVKDSSTHFQPSSTAVRQRGTRGALFRNNSIENMDLLGIRGGVSRKSYILRFCIVTYILGLHFTVFVVLTITGLAKMR